MGQRRAPVLPVSLALPLLIAKCQVELGGTDRLSGPSESPIASGSTCIAFPELCWLPGTACVRGVCQCTTH